MRPGAVWAFDVDGTLIGSVRSDVVRPGARELLDTLSRRQVRCVLWSAGGDDYADRIAAQHGLVVAASYAKHTRDDAGRYRIDHFPGADRPDLFVDDSPADLPEAVPVIAVPQFIGGNPADRALWSLIDEVCALRSGSNPA